MNNNNNQKQVVECSISCDKWEYGFTLNQLQAAGIYPNSVEILQNAVRIAVKTAVPLPVWLGSSAIVTRF